MINETMMNDSTIDGLSRFLDVDVARYELIGVNLANIDTPGYRTRDLDFHSELERVSALGVSETSGLVYAAYTPVVRRVRGLLERPDGNNVSVERESVLLAETQMKFNIAIQLLKDEFHTISQAINSGGGGTSS
jgi:flagellar basal-body rod protein FlgB